MTITKHCQAGPPEGTSKTSLTNSYRIPITCWSDDADDDAGVVIAYLKTTAGFAIGSVYTQPNYTDLFSVVKTINARKRSDSANPWIFDCTINYDQVNPNTEAEDEDGNLTESPEQWRYDIESSSGEETIPVWEAWNIDSYPRNPAEAWAMQRAANTLGPVVNSADVTLDPPLMKQRSIRMLRVSGNLNLYDEALLLGFEDKINSGSVQWHTTLVTKYGFAAKVFEPYEIWCTSASATYQRANNVGFWRYTYEFRFRDRDPNFYPTVTTPYAPSFLGDGWLVSVLDLGIGVWSAPGAPDGLGGVVPGSAGAPTARGAAEITAGKDYLGKRIPEKVLFDGQGMPATGSGSLAPSGVWFRYRVNDVGPFSAFPLDIFELP